MSGRRARARTATKARAMKGDARAARRIYLRFNRSKRAGDRLLSIIAHIRLAMLRRWLDELALSHNVEAMPDGAFDGPTVVQSGSAFALFVLVADMLAAVVLALFMVGAMVANQGHRAGWFALACAALAIGLIAEDGAK